MGLRDKIIFRVGFFMLTAMLVLFLVVVMISLYGENQRKRELGKLLKNQVPDLYHALSEHDFIAYINRQDCLESWRLMQNGRLKACSKGAEQPIAGERMNSVLVSQQDHTSLFFKIAGKSVIKSEHLLTILAGIFCILLPIIILYSLLSRLVLQPMETVISSCQNASRGIRPGSNPLSGRSDEGGRMVTELHQLLNELFAYRDNLEEQVKEISSKMQKAHESLMLSERLSATGKLAAGIAHEINNPLGGMLNAVNKLKRNASTQADTDYFDLLEECIHRIEKLVKELLTFVRSGQEHMPVPLHDCIEFSRRMIQHTLQEKSITFTCGANAEDIVVAGVAGELQQMFLNLFINACDSMNAGGGTLDVQTNIEKETVVVTITDNGCGIQQESLAQVFDLFYTGKEQGTGLGLSIVHSIVKNHQGTIVIESVVGTGTTVNITFPLIKEIRA